MLDPLTADRYQPGPPIPARKAKALRTRPAQPERHEKGPASGTLMLVGRASGSLCRAFRGARLAHEGAYLMHYSAKISSGKIAAGQVPTMHGVNIEWVHDSADASKKAATAMVKGYGIVFPPALISRYIERAAIDMTIGGLVGKKIKDASDKDGDIKKLSDLHAVGATYGVQNSCRIHLIGQMMGTKFVLSVSLFWASALASGGADAATQQCMAPSLTSQFVSTVYASRTVLKGPRPTHIECAFRQALIASS